MKHLTRAFLCISVLLIIYIVLNTSKNQTYKLSNPTKNMTATSKNEIVPYGVDYVYNSSKPSSAEPVVLESGVNGIRLTRNDSTSIDLIEAKNEIVEVGTGLEGEYTGRLTGYGADCYGCSSVGNVSCLTREGTKHSLINDGMYYTDSVYGTVRIIAAATSAFPCGTIMNIENDNIGKITAVVLDTGYSMRNAWSNGNMWIDLAFVSQEDARNGMATNDNTKFSVQRWGW